MARKLNLDAIYRADQDVFGSWIIFDQTSYVMSKAREHELKQYKLTIAQGSILNILIRENKGLTIEDITSWNAREPHSVLILVKRMEKNGLLKIKRSTNGGKSLITITIKGRRLYQKTTHRSIEMIFSALSVQDRKQLNTALLKLRAKSRELLGLDFNPPYLE